MRIKRVYILALIISMAGLMIVLRTNLEPMSKFNTPELDAKNASRIDILIFKAHYLSLLKGFSKISQFERVIEVWGNSMHRRGMSMNQDDRVHSLRIYKLMKQYLSLKGSISGEKDLFKSIIMNGNFNENSVHPVARTHLMNSRKALGIQQNFWENSKKILEKMVSNNLCLSEIYGKYSPCSFADSKSSTHLSKNDVAGLLFEDPSNFISLPKGKRSMVESFVLDLEVARLSHSLTERDNLFITLLEGELLEWESPITAITLNHVKVDCSRHLGLGETFQKLIDWTRELVGSCPDGNFKGLDKTASTGSGIDREESRSSGTEIETSTGTVMAPEISQ